MGLSTLASHGAVPTHLAAPVLDVVVPVHNEEIDLEPCVRRLHAYLAQNLPYPFRITIANNASTDSTADVAQRLTEDMPEVTAVHLNEKGRGRALKYVWTHSDAAVLAYLDVDLSTDLRALLPLVAPLISGHSDLAIGSRLARGSRVVRGAKREFISRSYNLLLRGTLSARFSDAQCGFKAIRALGIGRLPLAALREQLGRDPLSVAGIPAGLAGQLLRFAAVGFASTLAYLVLYAVLRTGVSPQWANLIGSLVTAVANTAANRRLTFGVRGSDSAGKHQAQGLVVFAVGLGLTSGSLALLHALHSNPPRTVELAILIAVNLAAAGARFLMMRVWVFRAEG
jgi:putative flippase GtrA